MFIENGKRQFVVYRCVSCDKKFFSLWGANQHLRLVHGSRSVVFAHDVISFGEVYKLIKKFKAAL
jgi:DNA-directed RNA polymerase subunit RPC12/RpoP